MTQYIGFRDIYILSDATCGYKENLYVFRGKKQKTIDMGKKNKPKTFIGGRYMKCFDGIQVNNNSYNVVIARYKLYTFLIKVVVEVISCEI